MPQILIFVCLLTHIWCLFHQRIPLRKNPNLGEKRGLVPLELWELSHIDHCSTLASQCWECGRGSIVFQVSTTTIPHSILSVHLSTVILICGGLDSPQNAGWTNGQHHTLDSLYWYQSPSLEQLLMFAWYMEEETGEEQKPFVFKASSLWADAFYKSKCPSVCLSVCLFVCLFTFEVPFQHLFAPTSQSRMSNIFRDSESLGKSNGKKWSQIWTFLFQNCLKLTQKKCFFFCWFCLTKHGGNHASQWIRDLWSKGVLLILTYL